MRLFQPSLPLLLAASAPVAQDPAAQDPGAAPEPPRPKPAFLQQNEDWSGLAGFDLAATDDPFDRIKFIPLTDDGAIWLSVGGRARARVEAFSDFNFGAPPAAETDDVYGLYHFLLHGDLHLGEDLRLFVQGKSALASGRSLPGGARPIDEDELELQQAFVDWTLPLGEEASLTLRPGRQMLLFAKQRLVGPLPWANTLRAWDGVSAVLRAGGWNLTGFLTEFVRVEANSFNEADGDEPFHGLYATRAVDAWEAGELDLYWLHRERKIVNFNGTSGAEKRDTFGTRLAGKAREGRFDWEVELATQTGQVGAADVEDAYMLGSQLGWRLPEAPGAPRLFVGLDYGSGDDEAGGEVNTFDQLYPLGHAYFGQVDGVGRKNSLGLSAGGTWQLSDRLELDLQNHLFWLADADDALYNAGGGATIAGGTSDERYLGYELDLRARYRLDRHWSFEAGYCHLFAGDVPSAAGPGEDIDFAYLQLQLAF